MVLLGWYQHPKDNKFWSPSTPASQAGPSMQNIPYAGPPAHLFTVLGTSKPATSILCWGPANKATSIPCWGQAYKTYLMLVTSNTGFFSRVHSCRKCNLLVWNQKGSQQHLHWYLTLTLFPVVYGAWMCTALYHSHKPDEPKQHNPCEDKVLASF